MIERMCFSGEWRDYQQRVLDQFDTLISDQRIHVVAAPGSGKTILGLELCHRLDRPSLVFAPTRTIRDQWIARLCPLFMAATPSADDVSTELEKPEQFTATTYQALHALWSSERKDGFAALIKWAKSVGPITLILDEAHHLRREWWNALQDLMASLEDARVVALTATPPYDAPFSEWARYQEMCGPADIEIGIPELVRNGDLCPHQDHVLFSQPSDDALALLDRRRRGLSAILQDMRGDTALLDWFQAHEWVTKPEAHVEPILEAPQMLSAILVFLAASGCDLPKPPLKLLGIGHGDIPLPSDFWNEVLLNGLLFDFPDIFPIGDERVRNLRTSLNELGLIEGKRVKLTESRSIFNLMAGNLAKLDSVAEIVSAESAALGADLRMAILSDHVRADDLVNAGKSDYRAAKSGVVPVFAKLQARQIEAPAAVLTGTLIIIPLSAKRRLLELASAMGIAEAELQWEALPGFPRHTQLLSEGKGERLAVQLVTTLLSEGAIRIVIGTQALLGEGWDAPAVNSLVLASNSAAYMLSNQMRGRAIRIDPANRDKVSNIWHLATVAALPHNMVSSLPGIVEWGRLADADPAGSDFDLLKRRFLAFEGISNSGSNNIESGISRLGISEATNLQDANARTLEFARNRKAIAETWRRSVGDAAARAHVRETASPNYSPRGIAWYDTASWLATGAVSSGAFAAAQQLRDVPGMATWGAFGMAAAGAATIAAAPKLLKALFLLYRNGTLESSVEQVGTAVVNALQRSDLLSAEEQQAISIEVRRQSSGRRDILVHGATRAAERMIINAIAEILSPIGNPRFLLARHSRLGFRLRTDYHAVPAILGQQERRAKIFHQEWRRAVGSSKLIHTRTPEGRIMLLRARARSFSAGFQRAVDRRSIWL